MTVFNCQSATPGSQEERAKQDLLLLSVCPILTNQLPRLVTLLIFQKCCHDADFNIYFILIGLLDSIPSEIIRANKCVVGTLSIQNYTWFFFFTFLHSELQILSWSNTRINIIKNMLLPLNNSINRQKGIKDEYLQQKQPHSEHNHCVCPHIITYNQTHSSKIIYIQYILLHSTYLHDSTLPLSSSS